jgi:peptide/nickel transport system substrate-binding protein
MRPNLEASRPVVALLLGVAVVLAGCLPGAPSAPGGAASKPKVMVVAQQGDATTLEPNMTTDTPTRNINLNLIESPVLRLPDGSFKPVLAESWENPDQNTWVFHVRKGVKFHNGYDLTAEDMKYSLDQILDPAQKSPLAANWPSVDRVEAPDQYTFVVHTKVPYPLTLARMSGSFHIASKRYQQEVGKAANEKPIGTGPYKFKEWVKDQQVVLEAFDGYWGGRPKIDQLVFRSIPESTTRIAELLSGNVHLTYGLNLNQSQDLQQKQGVKPIIGESTRVEFVALDNIRETPLKDQRVRQALNYGVDKEALQKAFFGGYGRLIGQPVSPPMFGFNPDVTPYPYDAEKARQLLTETGYPSGFTIDFEAPVSTKDVAEAVALQLAKIGVIAKLQIYDNTTQSQRTTARTVAPMFTSTWLGTTGDAEGTLTPRLSTGQNGSFFSDPDVDKQIRAGASTVVSADRLAVYKPLMQVMKDKAPWIYLWQGTDFYGVSSKLGGWTPRPDTYMLFNDATLAD